MSTYITCFADADLEGKEGYLVKSTGTDERVGLCTADTDAVVGVLYSIESGIGSKVVVQTSGHAAVRFNATAQAYDLLCPDTDGRAKVAASGDKVCGRFEPEPTPGSTDIGTGGNTGTHRCLIGFGGYILP